MKKLYTFAFGMMLAGLGFQANAAVTDLPVAADPEEGTTLTYSEMTDTKILVKWGEGAPLFYNTDAYPYYDEYDNCLFLDLLINGEETYDIVPAVIVSQEEDGQVISSYLEISVAESMGWEWYPEDYGDSFELSVIMPGGCIFVGEDGGDENADLTLNYNIGEGGNGGGTVTKYLPDPTFDLAEGNTLFICFDQQIEIVGGGSTVNAQMFVPGEGLPIDVQLFGPTTWIPDAVEGTTPEYNDNALILNLTSYISQYGDGTYRVFLNSTGVITSADGSLINDTFQWSGSLVKTLEPINYDLFEISGDVITLVYSGEVSVNPENEIDIVIYNTVNIDEPTITVSSENISIDETTVCIDLSSFELTDGDNYYLEIPEGYFLIGEEFINALVEESFDYETVGVNVIDQEHDNSSIYNINGVKIGNNLNGVSNGIYIINGKKILVRK